jgi:flagellin
MSMIINHNVLALQAQHSLGKTQLKYATALERLSTGLRINKAADDAAGLAIGEKLLAQVNGLQQAVNNAQDGISLVQTAEGALNETHDILQRMRELVVEAGGGTLTSTDQANIQAEITQLQAELDRIGNTTQYNGQLLLNGSFGSTVSGLGTALTPANGIVGLSSNGAQVAAGYTLTTAAGTLAGTVKITIAQGANSQTIDNVTVPTGFNTQTLNFSSMGISLTVNSALSNTTFITANNTFNVTSGTGNLLVGANGTAAENIGVSINDMRSVALGVDSSKVNVTSSTLTTQAMLASIDAAINTVSTQRANLGAIQNRLQHTINSLNVAVENTQASESQIMDADIAQETTNMVSAQILIQSGTSVLSQANQSPQAALALLPR